MKVRGGAQSNILQSSGVVHSQATQKGDILAAWNKNNTPEPLYNTVHYNMILDMTRISVRPQKLLCVYNLCNLLLI